VVIDRCEIRNTDDGLTASNAFFPLFLAMAVEIKFVAKPRDTRAFRHRARAMCVARAPYIRRHARVSHMLAYASTVWSVCTMCTVWSVCTVCAMWSVCTVRPPCMRIHARLACMLARIVHIICPPCIYVHVRNLAGDATDIMRARTIINTSTDIYMFTITPV